MQYVYIIIVVVVVVVVVVIIAVALKKRKSSSFPPPPPPPPSAPPSNPTPSYPAPQAINPGSPPPAISTGDSVMGALLLRKPKSLGTYDSFTGVVTNSRIIFAQMTSGMVKQAIQQARSQAKAEGKGFWGQWSEQLKASFGYTQRYLNMDPSVALSETPGNFMVSNNAISEIKLHLKNINKGQTQAQLHEFELEIKSASGKYKFRMEERDDYVRLLKQVYGEKLKMPFGYFSSHGVKFTL
jgi:hypothetical protein